MFGTFKYLGCFGDKIYCTSQWSSTFKHNGVQQVAISSGEMH
jgi:hypothetical protein